MSDGPSGFLSPYRVLDVTNHRGLLAGHMLAQLGADVVQMEPIGGSDGRRQPPFASDWSAEDSSFYWAAYASGSVRSSAIRRLIRTCGRGFWDRPTFCWSPLLPAMVARTGSIPLRSPRSIQDWFMYR